MLRTPAWSSTTRTRTEDIMTPPAKDRWKYGQDSSLLAVSPYPRNCKLD